MEFHTGRRGSGSAKKRYRSKKQRSRLLGEGDALGVQQLALVRQMLVLVEEGLDIRDVEDLSGEL